MSKKSEPKPFAIVTLKVWIDEYYSVFDAMENINSWIEAGREFAEVKGSVKVNSIIKEF